jgi:hypothetical protein
MDQQGKKLTLGRIAERRWASTGLFLFVACALPARGQATAPPSSQFQAVLAEAQSAVMGTNQPNSVVLNGTFMSTEGSLNQNGGVQLTAGLDGSYSISLSRSVGPVNESRSVTNGVPSCTWTDQRSIVHQSAFLNCLAPAWFFPGLTLLNDIATLPSWSPSSYTTDSLGNHLQFQFLLPLTEGNQEDPQLLKPFDLVLSPGTNLPQCAFFTVHPDNASVQTDIPVFIAYSNYQSISGVMIPYHIQRYVNGSLVLDITINSAIVQ